MIIVEAFSEVFKRLRSVVLVKRNQPGLEAM